MVSGYVRDAATGEELIGANVAILETGQEPSPIPTGIIPFP